MPVTSFDSPAAFIKFFPQNLICPVILQPGVHTLRTGQIPFCPSDYMARYFQRFFFILSPVFKFFLCLPDIIAT